MTTIVIDDGFDNDKYELEYVDWETVGMYDLLNSNEIRFAIANKFREQDEIKEADIYEAIDNYLQSLKDEIFGETCEILEFSDGKTIIK